MANLDADAESIGAHVAVDEIGFSGREQAWNRDAVTEDLPEVTVAHEAQVPFLDAKPQVHAQAATDVFQQGCVRPRKHVRRELNGLPSVQSVEALLEDRGIPRFRIHLDV